MARDDPPRTATPAPRPRRGRRILRKSFVVLGSVLLVLVAVELGLRGIGALLVVDQRGARSNPAAGAPEYTILCVGDSWTQGAPYGRYPELLVRRLNAASRSLRFRQVNTGRAGTNSSQSLHRLAAEIRAHRPDLLLVLTGNNDHHNLTESSYWRFRDGGLDGGSILAARLRVFAHSLRVLRVARLLGRQATGRPTANEFLEAGGGRSANDDVPVALDLETHRRQLEYNLTRFVELARRERVPIVLQTYFHFHGYRVNEIIRDVASRHDVPLVDHNRLFHTRIPPAERAGYRIADGHPSARGYALMADHIVEMLGEHALIPRAITPGARFREP